MSISRKIESSFIAIISGLSIPIVFLNLLGGIISGVWLAILGEWGEIIRGLGFLVVSGFAISFALMPGLLLAAPGLIAIKKGKKVLGTLLASINIFYTFGLITMWCVWVLWLFVDSATKSSLIPLLIWSYGVAVGPWMWLAQKDQEGGGNDFSIMSTFFAEVSYIIAMIMYFIGATIETIALVFGAIMFCAAIFQIFIALLDQKYHDDYPVLENANQDDETLEEQNINIIKKKDVSQKRNIIISILI